MNLVGLLPHEWREVLGEKVLSLEKILLPADYIPSDLKIFKALERPISELKVCIIGQDPYPNPDDAMGLAFSVPSVNLKLPPTLRNIFKELASDCQISNTSGDLTNWHNQGVLLLNRILTTEPGSSLAHRKLGWQDFTNEVVSHLSDRDIVFILWGESAGGLAKFLDPAKVIRSVHPSPLSAYRGFFGSRPFSRANEILKNLGVNEIDWRT